MEHWLEEICEPPSLVLAWQPPAPSDADLRWAVALISRDGDEAVLRYLAPGAEFRHWNQNREHEQLLEAGYAGYPAFSPRQREHRAGVMEAMMRRLPPRSRADFADYRGHFRIPAYVHVSNFGLLSITGAKLPNDGFSLVDPLNGHRACCDLMLEVAGFRYFSDKLDRPVEVGRRIELCREPTNALDPNAVALNQNHQKLGYINRLQTRAFQIWLAGSRVEAWAERLNGKPDHRRLFVFVRVRPALTAAAA